MCRCDCWCDCRCVDRPEGDSLLLMLVKAQEIPAWKGGSGVFGWLAGPAWTAPPRNDLLLGLIEATRADDLQVRKGR